MGDSALKRPYAQKLLKKLQEMESRKERAERLYAERRCFACGKENPRHPKRRCQECADRATENTQALQRSLIKRGLCVQCRGPNPKRRWRCDVCEQLRRQKDRKLRPWRYAKPGSPRGRHAKKRRRSRS